MGISWSTWDLHLTLCTWLLQIQGFQPKDDGRAISRQSKFCSTINQNGLYVNNKSHHKCSCGYRKAFEKPAQALLIEEIGEGKHVALQQLVNNFSEKKEMKRYETDPYLIVNNSGPEMAQRLLPWFNQVIITPPTPESPPARKAKWYQEMQRD